MAKMCCAASPIAGDGTTVAIRRLPFRGVQTVSNHHPTIAIAFFSSLLVACVHTPTEQLGKTEAAYRAAEEVGAAKQPSSAYHLKLAEEQIGSAKPLMDGSKKDKRAARDLLEQAELDSEVAIELWRSGDAQARAKQAWVKVNDLKTQNAVETAPAATK
jgi:Domain of unknown function (DUF4398)